VTARASRFMNDPTPDSTKSIPSPCRRGKSIVMVIDEEAELDPKAVTRALETLS